MDLRNDGAVDLVCSVVDWCFNSNWSRPRYLFRTSHDNSKSEQSWRVKLASVLFPYQNCFFFFYRYVAQSTSSRSLYVVPRNFDPSLVFPILIHIFASRSECTVPVRCFRIPRSAPVRGFLFWAALEQYCQGDVQSHGRNSRHRLFRRASRPRSIAFSPSANQSELASAATVYPCDQCLLWRKNPRSNASNFCTSLTLW